MPVVVFIVAAVALLAGWEWWRLVLVEVTLLSLLLKVLDWRVAYAGVVINIVILAVVWLGPHIAS